MSRKVSLITDCYENIEYLTESVEIDGVKEKTYFLEGIFAQSEVKNGNNRIYPESVLDEGMYSYIDKKVNRGISYGELDHPVTLTVKLENTCLRVEKLEKQGTNWIGKARVLSKTPKGSILHGLLEEKCQISVSTRGGGVVDKNNNTVKKGFIISAIDAVSEPSAPNAFVNGIMEGIYFNIDKNDDVISIDKFHEKYKDFLTEGLQSELSSTAEDIIFDKIRKIVENYRK